MEDELLESALLVVSVWGTKEEFVTTTRLVTGRRTDSACTSDTRRNHVSTRNPSAA